jgi:TM2 domain-containing membrane protein YozV
MSYSPGPGTSGNVIAAVCSFFFPGLGQLVQGRLLAAIFFFVLACLLWVVLLGWLVHLLAALNAALYRG